MLKLTTRECTVFDFVENKNRHPWKFYRSTGKTTNFALIFSAKVPTLAAQLKNNGFEENDCDLAVADLGLEPLVKKYAGRPNPEWDERDKRVMPKYLACAEAFRKAFFTAYPGIDERCTREFLFARERGYVRTWHGPVRHLPELKLAQFEPGSTMPAGADKKYFSRMLSNLKNAAGNSTIQSLEAYHAFTTLHEVNVNLRAWGFHSRLINLVHDSGDFEVLKDEADLVYALVNHCSSTPKPPYVGVPILMDGEAADLSDHDQYYKNGKGIELGDLDEELAKYNSKHGTDLKFHPACPR